MVLLLRFLNEKALEAILKIPEVYYVEPDIKVKAFIQVCQLALTD
jgi:hypothetical protein